MPRPRKSASKLRRGLAVYMEPATIRRLREVAESERRSASTQAALFIEIGLGIRTQRGPLPGATA